MEVGDLRKEEKMRLEPQVLIKHKHGVTMQWWSQKDNYLVVVTYCPIDGTDKYALSNVAGPWSGVIKQVEDRPETWKPTILPGFERERAYALVTADIVLMCLNSPYGGIQALPAAFHGPILGFDELQQN